MTAQFNDENARHSDAYPPIAEEAIRELAYHKWVSRGRPLGSDKLDYFAAEEELRHAAIREAQIRVDHAHSAEPGTQHIPRPPVIASSIDSLDIARLKQQSQNSECEATRWSRGVSSSGATSVKALPKKQPSVFLSTCHDDDIARLHVALQAHNLDVWSDHDILPGQDWKAAIRKAMKQCDVVVLCLSAESVRRKQTGIYPEARDAIAAYRQRRSDGIYLIPVRLTDCEIPDIEIDDTRTLDSLQHVDLFPEAAWDANLQRLVTAIRASASA